MARIERIADDLVVIDVHYNQTPQVIGSYLLLGERPALIETGPTSTLETLLAGVREAGVDPRDLRAVAVTHIHLDHAGGAGTLARRVPQLEGYVHPAGAPHLIDPARLVASARRLYRDGLQRVFRGGSPAPRGGRPRGEPGGPPAEKPPAGARRAGRRRVRRRHHRAAACGDPAGDRTPGWSGRKRPV